MSTRQSSPKNLDSTHSALLQTIFLGLNSVWGLCVVCRVNVGGGFASRIPETNAHSEPSMYVLGCAGLEYVPNTVVQAPRELNSVES
ncbi:hypothetical protein BJY00DRAFT_272704 [Aspergillus carlsbadensis]|nr:hypothetical protein BJY00DRAFT_272704 [Aspergillus carlsbadensis]